MTDAQKEQIKQMRKQGIGYMKIGQELGIPHNTVRSFCRRNGLDGTLTLDFARCKQCGRIIRSIPNCKPKKFCSDACRTAWWNSHPKEVKRNAVYCFTCAYCGKNFKAYGNKKRKYCTHACYIADRYGKERDADE